MATTTHSTRAPASKRLTRLLPVFAPFAVYGLITALVALFGGR
jgi:hypothetical protein